MCMGHTIANARLDLMARIVKIVMQEAESPLRVAPILVIQTEYVRICQ